MMMASAVSAAGCANSGRPDLEAADPALRIAAMRDAVASDDRSAIPALVERLESDDSGVRFAAIDALDRLTGMTFGYHYDAPAAERAAAVTRWVDWLRVRHTGATVEPGS